ncbi:MAG TPA: sensor histidine kinase [Savagea sp.]
MTNERNIDVQRLESVFENMLKVMDNSKKDIFSISEQTRKSYEALKQELEEVQRETDKVINRGDELEKLTHTSRQRLAEVSKNFEKFTENELKRAYEVANDLVVQLSINRLEEKQLRTRRDDLERRLIDLLKTIERADQLANQVSTVLTYLTSDLKEVGPALETARQRQEFAIKIIQAQEEERKRLSREIHDGPAQLLANVSLRTGLIEQMCNPKVDENVIKELRDLRELAREALHEVRRIIYDLRPMALDDLGLVPTLKKYLKKMMGYNEGVYIHFTSKGPDKRFDSNFEASAFRLIQESVSNALKHAEAKDIWVKLEWLHDTMNIVVKDNGKGFAKEEIKDKTFGLIGMHERIELLKGTIRIDSKIGQGTTVFIQIPIDEETMIKEIKE